MKRYRGTASLNLFDHRYPPVSWAKEHYTFLDKSGCNLTGSDIADMILELKHNTALVLPDRNYYGGQPYKHRDTGTIIPLDTPARFRKFGPQIDLVKSGTTIGETKERKTTPRKAFRQLGEEGTRETLRSDMYRGLGFWSPRARRHNIIWFDVLAEGQAYLDFFQNEFKTRYQFADAYHYIPSFKQTGGTRITQLKVLPVTERNGEYFVEWLEEHAQCNCADVFFMGSKSKKKTGDRFEGFHKYANPEQEICRHNWAQRILAEREAEKNPERPRPLVKWPKATGFMEPWRKAKMQVYIREGSGLRRPLKAEVGIFCQYMLGTLTPDEAFDLSE